MGASFFYITYSTHKKSLSAATTILSVHSKLGIQPHMPVTKKRSGSVIRNAWMSRFPDLLLGTRTRDLTISTYMYVLYVGLRRIHLIPLV